MPLIIFMPHGYADRLGLNQWTDYTRGFCHYSGTITEKILMMGISAIYFVRISLLLRKNIASTFENEAKLLADRAEDSVFDFYTRLDWLHQFSFFVNII